MKTFEIYASPATEIEAVKRGFFWPAALFAMWWALCKGLWFTGLGIVFCGVLFAMFAALAPHEGASVLWFVFEIGSSAIIGANANTWRSNKLKLRGYQFQTRLTAESAEEAIRQYRAQFLPTVEDEAEVIAA